MTIPIPKPHAKLEAKMRIVFAILALSVTLAYPAAHDPIRGFDDASLASEVKWEQQARAIPDAARIRPAAMPRSARKNKIRPQKHEPKHGWQCSGDEQRLYARGDSGGRQLCLEVQLQRGSGVCVSHQARAHPASGPVGGAPPCWPREGTSGISRAWLQAGYREACRRVRA